MKEVTILNMITDEWYYIETTAPTSFGSGRQIGCFDKTIGDVAHFSKITDIQRPDGTMGCSALSNSGLPGARHKSFFLFYKPMTEILMRRALMRRFICRTHQVDCEVEEYI